MNVFATPKLRNPNKQISMVSIKSKKIILSCDRIFYIHHLYPRKDKNERKIVWKFV